MSWVALVVWYCVVTREISRTYASADDAFMFCFLKAWSELGPFPRLHLPSVPGLASFDPSTQ